MTKTQSAEATQGTRQPSHVQWLLALGAWTVFVWVQRIGNVLGADDLDGFGQLWRLGVAGVFVVAGAGVIGGVVAGRRSGGVAPWVSPLGVGLAVVGVLWWVARGSQILVGDWDLSFKLVHTALALVVVGLSVMVWRTRGYDHRHHG